MARPPSNASITSTAAMTGWKPSCARSVPILSGSDETPPRTGEAIVITLALSKGRIFEETLPLLRAAGIDVAEDPERSRKLILATSRADVRLVLVRASDV